MFQKLFNRRKGVAMATAAFGLSVASLAFAGTAGATTTSVLNGGGSNTAYEVMGSLSLLFSQSPGCAEGTATPVTYTCSGTYSPGATGEDGYAAASENPYNDVAYQEPAIGSGAGVNELNSNAVGNTPLSFARASSGPYITHGTSADNYIAYAIDGVSWVCFRTSATGFCNSSVKSMTLQNLADIYNNHLQCTIGGSPVTMDWRCLNGDADPSTPQPIDCYMAQNGSGTEKAWASQVVAYPNDSSYNSADDTPACLSNESVGTSATHLGLFENEISAIVDTHSAWYNNDIPNAIYFFSYGKYSTQCKSNRCPQPAGDSYQTYLGSVKGPSDKKAVAPSAKSIVLDVNSPTNAKAFPIYRFLYNVVENSSAATPSSNAALNFVSEFGFLCKTGTVADIDPLTNVSYRTEIETGITQSGFFPLDTSPSSPFNEYAPGVVSSPDTSLSSDPYYSLIDNTSNTTNPSGFCLVRNGNSSDIN
ncbi:MAG: hypothetical protein ACLQPH_08285 [Acidimicrobiales bacterium]